MLTRKMLKAMGIEDEKIDQIIEAHTETTDSLKADRDKYKEEADSLKEAAKEDAKTLKATQKELEETQNKVKEFEPYKEKYESEHEAFDKYKKGISEQQTKAKKADAYKALLKEAGVSEKRLDAIVKVTAIDDLELDEKGAIKDSDKLIEGIKQDWSEFIVTETQKGAQTKTPPANAGAKMTKEEIMKIKDRNDRQRAIEENHELFGF